MEEKTSNLVFILQCEVNLSNTALFVFSGHTYCTHAVTQTTHAHLSVPVPVTMFFLVNKYEPDPPCFEKEKYPF